MKTMKPMKPFIQQIIEDSRPVEELMDFIGYESDDFSSLREALGLTPEQYVTWSKASTNGKDHHAIFQQIAMEEKQKKDLGKSAAHRSLSAIKKGRQFILALRKII
jgi:hypothetical protein